MTCPNCGSRVLRAIYMGAPMWLCAAIDCRAAGGLGAWLASVLPVATEDDYGEPAFAFFVHEDGYWTALWRWLRGEGG